MQKYYLYIITACIFIMVGVASLFSAPRNLKGGELEIFPFDVKYDGLKGVLECLIVEDTVYLPLTQFFYTNKIYFEAQEEMRVIRGFYMNPEDTFNLNFDEMIAYFKENQIPLEDNEIVFSDMEIYVLPDFLVKVFEIPITVNFAKLRIYVGEDAKLPVITQFEKKKEFDKNKKKEKYPGSYKSINKRNFTLLDGGRLDYNIYANKTGERDFNYNFINNLGLEALGGDFKYSIYGSYNSDRALDYRHTASLAYTFNNDYLSHVMIGNLYNFEPIFSSNGLASVPTPQLEGIKISNYRFNPSKAKTILHKGKAKPYWTAELYEKDRMIDMIVADSAGNYSFNLPNYYGYHDMFIKLFGLKGEVEIKDIGYFIPQNYVEPGNLMYSLSGGRSFYNNNIIGDAMVNVGIFHNLNFNARYQEDFTVNKRYLTGQINTTFGKLQTGINYFHENSAGAYINYAFEALSVRLLYNKNLFEDRNGSKIIQSVQSNLIFRNDFLLPFNFSVRTSLQDYTDRYQVRYNLTLTSRLKQLRLTAKYSDNLQFVKNDAVVPELKTQILNLSASYLLSSRKTSFEFLTGLSVGAHTNIDANKMKPLEGGAMLRIPIIKKFYLSLVYSRDFQTGRDRLNTSMSMYLPYFSSQSNLMYGDGSDYSLSQNLRGSIGFNSDELDFDFSGDYRQNYSAAGANIFLFIDKDMDNKFSKGDKIIEDSKIVFVGGVNKFENKKGRYNLASLMPYTEYKVFVEAASKSNPFILPSVKDFSFITGTNSVKTIAIPCYTSGIVEGKVYHTASGKGQDRIRVHIISQDGKFHATIPVFSDGEFYKSDIPSGKYIAYVDSMQLHMLKVKSIPPFTEIVVPVQEEGFETAGVDFALESLENIAANEISKAELTTAKQESRLLKQTDNYLLIENPLGWRSFISNLDAVVKKLKNDSKLALSVDINSGKGINTAEAANILSDIVNYFIKKGISSDRIKSEYFERGKSSIPTLELNIVKNNNFKKKNIPSK